MKVIWVVAVHRLRDQDPDVPVPHLAARRARRGADGDHRHPRRRAAEDGHLRHPAHQLRPPARGDGVGGAGDGGLRRDQHPLRRVLRDGAEGPEEARRLLLGQPHGLLPAGDGGADAAGHPGAIVQMFNHGTITGMLFTLVGVVYDRAHTRDIDKFGGLATRDAALHGVLRLRLHGLARPAGPVRLHRRGADLHRRVPASTAVLTILAATGVIVTAALPPLGAPAHVPRQVPRGVAHRTSTSSRSAASSPRSTPASSPASRPSRSWCWCSASGRARCST